MTAEQKFFFDLHGWIVVPLGLSAAAIAAARREVYGLQPPEHNVQGGGADVFSALRSPVCQSLLDHPVVAGVMTELLAPDGPGPNRMGPSLAYAEGDRHPFRCEHSLTTVRAPGWDVGEPNSGFNAPHVVRPPQQANAMRYQVDGGRIFGGLTTMILELNEVRAGEGGTLFLSGSHKAAFGYGGPSAWVPNAVGSPFEQSIRDAMTSYSCAAGTAVIFTESTLHMATPMLPAAATDRVSIFARYNSVWANWISASASPGLAGALPSMPDRRRSLFRGVHHD
jgi:hypothetical protein